ncbi:response regulator [Rheinheimera sp.]|uniref:response regulator n=1 Tax=Rheinheimera sp. TaxID=1869214 RepID=UPI00307F389F
MDQAFFRSKKVLVIDDCAPVRATIKGMLQLMGFDAIFMAKDADEAITACHELPFDLILCDFNLGQCKDGYQLFEYLKDSQLLAPLCCFIVISAENQRQIVHGLIELQPDDYLLKPFSQPALIERISRAMLQKRALRKVFFALFEQDYQAAIDECDLLLKQKTEHSLMLLRLKGELLLKQKRYSDAERFYQAVQKQKNYNWARLGYALCCFYLQRWEDTELELADLTQFSDTKVEALDWLSRLYLRHGRYQLAYDSLLQASLLSPKNISRQQNLSLISALLQDFPAAARIRGKIVQFARYSKDDTPDNYLNYARALVDQAQDLNLLEKTVQLQNASKSLDELHKRFNPEQLQQAIGILRSRMLSAKAQLKDARQQLQHISMADIQQLSVDTCLDALKAYYQLGDLYACELCIARLDALLQGQDYLTETQRILLTFEQQKHDQLKQQLKQINSEATDAYQQGLYGRAVMLFCETLDFMPTNPMVALNVLQSMSKAAGLTSETLPYAKQAAKVLRQQELPSKEQARFERYVSVLKSQQPALAQVPL